LPYDFSFHDRHAADAVKFHTFKGCDLAHRLEVTAANGHALPEPEPFVRLSNHGASALEFTVRVWVNSADYWDVNFDLKERVKKAFDANAISIPFPQMDVHVDNRSK